MKAFLFPIIIFLVALLFVACDTSSNLGNNYQKDELLEVLRDVPGLSVIGDGEFATIRIRGMQNTYGDGEPLFVVNGREYTNGFQSVYHDLNPGEIYSIELLRNPSELYKYGQYGKNGVVEIRLR